LFCSLIVAGELMFAVGIQVKQYYLCLVGRFVFGLGGESLTVAQNNFTARWFNGPQLALAFGLVLSFARIGAYPHHTSFIGPALPWDLTLFSLLWHLGKTL